MAETGCLRNAIYQNVEIQQALISKVKTTAVPQPLNTLAHHVYLQATDSGKFVMGRRGHTLGNGGIQFFLPDIQVVDKGTSYEFFLASTAIGTGEITIKSLVHAGGMISQVSPLIVGARTGPEHRYNHLSPLNTITFTSNSGGKGATCGDYVKLYCDGNNWFMDAYSSKIGGNGDDSHGITLTDT